MDNWSYDLVVTGLLTPFSIQPLATLNQQSYDMMLDCMQGLYNGVSGWYQFPHYDTLREVRVVIEKRTINLTILHLNLGMIELSVMDDNQLQDLITGLKELKNQSIGSKVYFL
jgi:hypothetical protein